LGPERDPRALRRDVSVGAPTPVDHAFEHEAVRRGQRTRPRPIASGEDPRYVGGVDTPLPDRDERSDQAPDHLVEERVRARADLDPIAGT